MPQIFQAIFDFASVWGNGILTVVIVGAIAGNAWLWQRSRDLPVGQRSIRILNSRWSFALVVAVVGLYVINIRMAPMTGALSTLQEARGERVPRIAFRQVADDTLGHLEDYRGQVVVLNLWATWCPPCLDELPTLDRLHRSYRDQGLTVIALSDESRQHLQDFFDKDPVELIAVYTEQYNWLLIDSFRPLTLIIDREGILRDHLLGARSFEDFESRILPHL